MTALAAPHRRLPAHPSSVAQARTVVRHALGSSAPEALLDDAILVVSEVVTNALVHAGTPIGLSVRVLQGAVRVEVSDGSTEVPVPRAYTTMTGTGRGMRVLEHLVDRWGVESRTDGKTVWFEIGHTHVDVEGPGEPTASSAHAGSPENDERVAQVTLRNVPLLLHTAWHQHAEAMLREYLLLGLDDDGATDKLEAHAAAHEAIALLVRHVPSPQLGDTPEELLATAIEPHVSQDEVLLAVPRTCVPSFRVLDDTLAAASELAESERLLTPPIQPEMHALTAWLCHEVAQQSQGAPGAPWSGAVEATTRVPGRRQPDLTFVTASQHPLVAADDHNRIVAVSRSALDLLGYPGADDLVGRRIVDLIPFRYHQAHLAGFALHLSIGRSPLLDHPVTVPVLTGEGGEITVVLTVTKARSGEEALFIARLTPALDEVFAD